MGIQHALQFEIAATFSLSCALQVSLSGASMGGAVGASVTEKLWSVGTRYALDTGSIWNSFVQIFLDLIVDQKKSLGYG